MIYEGLTKAALLIRNRCANACRIVGILGVSRRLMLLLGIVIAGPANASNELMEWRFDVLLDGREIGTHAFSLQQQGNTARMQSEARFDVKLLFVNAFRYRHRAEETWLGPCLVDIQSSTAVNSKSYALSGVATDTGFQLSARKGKGEGEGKSKDAVATRLPPCVQSFAYWNLDLLRGNKLLNPQTGEYETVQLTQLAPQAVRIGNTQLPAERYQLLVAGKAVVLWYAAEDGRWLALESEARGGRTLRYQPTAVPAAASNVDHAS